MGRRNVVRLSSLDVNVAGYAAVADTIDKFKDAEEAFYKARETQLNRYPGLSTTADKIEQEYDKLWGNDPWNYSSRAGSSSDQRTETDASTDANGIDADRLYVRIPHHNQDGLLEGITGTIVAHNSIQEHYLLYNPGVGLLNLDLTFENTSLFQAGTSGQFEINDAEYAASSTGFGEVPTFYNSNNNYTGKQLHMFRKLGTLYDSSVAPKYNDYTSAKGTYDNNNGRVIDTPILRTSFDFAWNDHQGVDRGYNRPSQLKRKLRKEAMGFN
jgi:hypothetical protein